MIDVGNIWSCYVPFEVTSMSYVLVSFNLNKLAVAQALTSPMYECMQQSSLALVVRSKHH